MVMWHFYEKVYRRWVVLCIGPFEDFKKELEDCRFNDMEWVKDGKGMCVELTEESNDSGQQCTMVWLKEFESATLVHELSHLVMMCFTQVDVPISRENTEAFAFYLEYWHTEMLKVRRKYPNGRPPSLAKQ